MRVCLTDARRFEWPKNQKKPKPKPSTLFLSDVFREDYHDENAGFDEADTRCVWRLRGLVFGLVAYITCA